MKLTLFLLGRFIQDPKGKMQFQLGCNSSNRAFKLSFLGIDGTATKVIRTRPVTVPPGKAQTINGITSYLTTKTSGIPANFPQSFYQIMNYNFEVSF